MEELISVIVPIYNAESTLERCIDSILAQTYSNLEIILINDGSKDNSYQICKDYMEKYDNIKVFSKENGGLAEARNVGVQYATGEYIGFVDSDDWIVEDAYELLYKCLKQENADIACGKIVKTSNYINKSHRNRNRVIKVYNQNEYAKKYFKVEKSETVFYVVNKLYRKEIAREMIFPKDIRVAEDILGFYLALVNSEKIVEIDEDIYFYWDNPNSITATWFSRKHLGINESWKRVMEDVEARKPEWSYYAKINYYRSYFGVLCRLMLEERESEFELEEKELIEKVRKYYKDLIRSPIPISRKIIMTIMYINYPMTKKIVRFYLYKIRKTKFTVK